MTEQMTYEEAMIKLEDLVARMENNELNIDQMGSALSEAKELIKLCQERLYQVDEEVKNILGITQEE